MAAGPDLHRPTQPLGYDVAKETAGGPTPMGNRFPTGRRDLRNYFLRAFAAGRIVLCDIRSRQRVFSQIAAPMPLESPLTTAATFPFSFHLFVSALPAGRTISGLGRVRSPSEG